MRNYEIIWGTTEAVEEKSDESTKQPVAQNDYVPLTVESVDNHIYFYAPINTDRTLDLIRNILRIDRDLMHERMSRSIPEDFPKTPIWLHIQSFGGGLFAGFSVADQIRNVQSPIYSVVEGVCASAATLISVPCAKRYITQSGFMLIHQFSSIMWGKYEEFKDEMKMMDMAMERLVAFYDQHTEMDEKKVRELLKRESWFSAQESVELGLADEIYGL